VLSTNVGGGTFQMDGFPADIRSPSVSVNLPSVAYSTPSASTNASIAPVTMITPAVNQEYEMHWYLEQTVVGTSCAGDTTVNLNVIWQDPIAAGTATNAGVYALTQTGGPFNGVLGAAFFFRNQSTGIVPIRAKAGVAIQYSTTYNIGSGCSPGPSYQVFPVLEQVTAN
jgi:hypothetical protein